MGSAPFEWQQLILAGLVLAADSGAASPDPLPVSALKRLSVEDLANIEVTTVERRGEPLALSAAAVYVLTGEDVHRSGATTIAEALRYVPGVQVGRVDASNWAVSARGFNDLFANKLLVLIDGRSVYSPINSGVYWNTQDVLLQDLDRIEIIRGPGATMWGANAVNGVINILTKPAGETQGLLMSAGGGNYETALTAIRYGGRVNDTTAYRVYGKYSNRDNFPLADGSEAHDRWWMTQGGFRIDWDPTDVATFTLQGDLYTNEADEALAWPTLTPPTYFDNRASSIESTGANLLGRWIRRFSEESDLQLRAYYDFARRSEKSGVYSIDIHQLDLDLQHRFPIGPRNQVMWGLGYRHVRDSVNGGPSLRFQPAAEETHLASAFVQDEIELVPERLSLVLGAKVEHNDYTGFELQPSAQLRWTPDDRQTVWASVARAVRTPSRSEADVYKPIVTFPPASAGGPPTVLTLVGTDQLDTEELLAFELGYRIRPTPAVAIDLALFANDYDRLTSVTQGAPNLGTLPDFVTMPLTTSNDAAGESFGAELAVNVQINDWWRIRTGYTWLHVNTVNDGAGAAREKNSPAHQAFVVSQMDLPHDLTFDLGTRFVDQLEGADIPAYVTLDARLAWTPRPNFEVALVGQNLCDDRHPEFQGSPYTGSQASEVPRSIYAILTWRY